jgi:hypothetical protein
MVNFIKILKGFARFQFKTKERLDRLKNNKYYKYSK